MIKLQEISNTKPVGHESLHCTSEETSLNICDSKYANLGKNLALL